MRSLFAVLYMVKEIRLSSPDRRAGGVEVIILLLGIFERFRP